MFKILYMQERNAKITWFTVLSLIFLTFGNVIDTLGLILAYFTWQLCLLSDLLLEMSHFEWILGVLLEYYQNNPAEDDITSEYIVPTMCKALAVLRVVST